MKTEKIKEIIGSYCVPRGVSDSSIENLFKELNLNSDNFYQYMYGQTTAKVGGEAIYYFDDIVRFANNSLED